MGTIHDFREEEELHRRDEEWLENTAKRARMATKYIPINPPLDEWEKKLNPKNEVEEDES